MSGPKNFYNAVDITKIGIPAMQEDIANLKEKSLPDVTEVDAGKVLKVNESGEWAAENLAAELPNVTVDDNGKLLEVVDGVWSKSESTLTEIQKNISNINKTLEHLLLPPKTKIHEWAFGVDDTSLTDTIDGSTTFHGDGYTYESDCIKFTGRHSFLRCGSNITNEGNEITIEYGTCEAAFNTLQNAFICGICSSGNGAFDIANAYGLCWSGSDDCIVTGHTKGYDYSDIDVYDKLTEIITPNIMSNSSITLACNATTVDVYISGIYVATFEKHSLDRLVLGMVSNYGFYTMRIKKVTVVGN